MLFLGLDGAGKTTALYQCLLGEEVTTISTIGFNVETIDAPGKPGAKLTVFDVGGTKQIRALWRHYFANLKGLVWFVDRSRPERYAESKEELMKVLADEELQGVPLLVMANKADLPGSTA